MNSERCYVYRYIDLKTGNVKYIGISKKGREGLDRRIKQHSADKWKSSDDYIDIIEVDTISSAEALESHFISLYNSQYNKSKKTWGIITSLCKSNYGWKKYEPTKNYCCMGKSKFRTERALAKYQKQCKQKIIALNVEQLSHILVRGEITHESES